MKEIFYSRQPIHFKKQLLSFVHKKTTQRKKMCVETIENWTHAKTMKVNRKKVPQDKRKKCVQFEHGLKKH
jgi:hypothetical protein